VVGWLCGGGWLGAMPGCYGQPVQTIVCSIWHIGTNLPDDKFRDLVMGQCQRERILARRAAWGRPLQQQNAPRVPCNYLLHIHPGALRARSPGPTARRVGGPCWQHGFEGRALMSQSLVGRQRGIGTQAVVPSVGHFDHPLPAHLNEAPIHHGAGASPKAPLQARQRPAWLGRPS